MPAIGSRPFWIYRRFLAPGADDGNVHEDNIDALAAIGIVLGTGDGNFDPSGDVRRDQMASFLIRLAQHLASEGDSTSEEDGAAAA